MKRNGVVYVFPMSGGKSFENWVGNFLRKPLQCFLGIILPILFEALCEVTKNNRFKSMIDDTRLDHLLQHTVYAVTPLADILYEENFSFRLHLPRRFELGLHDS